VVSLLFLWLGVRSQNLRARTAFFALAVLPLFPLVSALVNRYFAGEPHYAFTNVTPGPPAGSPSVVRMVPFPVTRPGVPHRASWSGGDLEFRILTPGLEPHRQRVEEQP
jgi:hypothetical protein